MRRGLVLLTGVVAALSSGVVAVGVLLLADLHPLWAVPAGAVIGVAVGAVVIAYLPGGLDDEPDNEAEREDPNQGPWGSVLTQFSTEADEDRQISAFGRRGR